MHRFDAGTPAGETMTALDDIVRSGRARYLGASAMYAWLAKLQHAAAAAGLTRFAAMQNRYNLVNREDERDLIPLCCDLGLGVIRTARWLAACWPGTRTRDGARRTTRARADRGDRPADDDVADAVQAVADRERGLLGPRSPSPGCSAGTASPHR